MISINNKSWNVAHWLLKFGEINLADTDHDGNSAWNYLTSDRFLIEKALGGHNYNEVFKLMLARSVPTPYAINRITGASSLGMLVAKGTAIRERFPSNSQWRADRASEIGISDFGQQLAPALLALVQEYAIVIENDLWNILEKEQKAANQTSRGVKRKFEGTDHKEDNVR